MARRLFEHLKNRGLELTLILLLVPLEVLLCSALHTAVDVDWVGSLILIESFHDKEVLVVHNDLRVDWIEGASAERQVVDGIQEVGLALAVMPDKAVEIGRKLKRSLTYILEI